jgi:type IV pilus assembly protein PilC
MGRFLYQARDGRGELATGVVNAGSVEEAGVILRGEGKYIVKLSPVNEGDLAAAPVTTEQRSRRIKRREVIFFSHQLAVMIETGVPISDALECCHEQTPNPDFAAVLKDVTQQVRSGSEFSAALRKYPRVFPTVMVSLIRASEVSGTMGSMLDQISQYMAKEQHTLRQARGAMMYPAFMMVMAVSVTIFLLAFVLPRFAAIYQAREAVLPLPTRILLATSHGMTAYWYIWVALVAAFVATIMLGRKTTSGRRVIDWLKLHTPIIGPLFSKLYITRACRTMGTMISAGVSMLDMIAIVKHVTSNAYFEDLWDDVDERLRQGSQLSEPLFASDLIPRSISQMIYSGERSGRLGKVLMRVADFTEIEFDQNVKQTTQFIEPLMVGVMGGLIGFVAISLLLPIFSVGRVMAS